MDEVDVLFFPGRDWLLVWELRMMLVVVVDSEAAEGDVAFVWFRGSAEIEPMLPVEIPLALGVIVFGGLLELLLNRLVAEELPVKNEPELTRLVGVEALPVENEPGLKWLVGVDELVFENEPELNWLVGVDELVVENEPELKWLVDELPLKDELKSSWLVGVDELKWLVAVDELPLKDEPKE